MTVLSPILVAGLFHELHGHLLELLGRLSAEDWNRPTVCSLWTVKDIASHLLDGDLRRLAAQRDHYQSPDAPTQFASYQELLAHLNQLNADWTKSTRRISPRSLIELLRVTGMHVADLLEGVDPLAPATFSVAWSGEDDSLMWFDVAREYTERWHHQRQIADAAGAATPIDARHLYHPVLRTFLRALPFTYRHVQAPPGATVLVRIVGEAGGDWSLCRDSSGWSLLEWGVHQPEAAVIIPQGIAWKLFTKRMDSSTAIQRFPEINITGNHELGSHVLEMVSIMA